MTAEGWGGSSRKAHYIRDGKVLCGRTPPGFVATIDQYYKIFEDVTGTGWINHPHYCRFCFKKQSDEKRAMLAEAGR